MEIDITRNIVVKIGGSTLGNHDTTLEDLVVLQKRGILPIVVHGGGNKVTEWLKRQNTPTSFKDGIRITDEYSLEMVAAVLGGLVNTDLVAAINSMGGKAVGMTGVDGNLTESKCNDPDLGYAGKITKVNPEVIESILDAGFIPFIAPPGAKSPEEPANIPYVNINGDDIAAALADALHADKLIFLTDVDGIRDGNGQVLPKLSASDVKSLMNSGVISGGMIAKAEAALLALEKTSIVQIIDGCLPHALLTAIEGGAIGTVITS
ncbi:MAG: acetylglutamate kinase [Chloroflexi bacterium]|nr:acetylglutamate kinase [Chloroflexota bacterium]